VGHIDSKFGISIHQLPHILRIIENTKMHINGIHMHTGSDILDVEVFLYAAEILFETAKNFKELDFIDFGSGFKVPYKKDDIETNVEEFGRKLTKRFLAFEKEYGRPLTLAFEPGKFLVSEAGYFLAKVNVVKQTTSTVFAGIDSGFNHLIRPMLYGSQHHIENISNPKGKGINIITDVRNFIENSSLTNDFENINEDIKKQKIWELYRNLKESTVNDRMRQFVAKSPDILKPILQS
jgi:diaminopimelate decarboxylase